MNGHGDELEGSFDDNLGEAGLGKTVAAACEDETCRAAYLYAVTTHPDFRCRGICKELIAYTEKALRKRYYDCMLTCTEVLYDDFLAFLQDESGDKMHVLSEEFSAAFAALIE